MAADAEALPPAPPGWVKPKGLTHSTGLDRDVAAGLEFLAALDHRLHDIAVRIYMLERRLGVIERRQSQAAAQIDTGLAGLAERLAALEALLRDR